MTLEIYFAYVVASLILLAVPGPTVMLVVSYALAQGRKSALASVAGVGVGDAVAAGASLMGLGAVLAASATLFTILKWVGGLYIIYLGIQMWRAKPHALETVETKTASSRKVFLHTFAVTALNPKGIAFFVAFLPHFIVPESPVVPQFFILGTTFVVLGMVNAALYAYLASSVRERVRKPSTLRAMNRLGGSVLVAAGIMTATLRRAAG